MVNKMSDEIYIIGHMNPDTDAICSAIAYAEFKKRTRWDDNYIPARIGDINPETAYVLDRFGFEEPLFLDNGRGKKLILVDHNEESQSIDGYQDASILEVIDHHKINFKCSDPIFFHTEPLGSTATIIADKFLSCDIYLTKGTAGILLASILSDTVAFKSPTTTDIDIEIAEKLSKIAEIEDIREFGIEIKKKKSSLEGMGVEDIIRSDFKDFYFSGNKVGIGQIEVVDFDEYRQRRDEFLKELKKLREKGNYGLLLFMVTNIMEEGSEILAAGKTKKVEEAFGKPVVDGSVYLNGVLSRKKQVVPRLESVF